MTGPALNVEPGGAREIGRVPTPDGVVEVVLVETNGGDHDVSSPPPTAHRARAGSSEARPGRCYGFGGRTCAHGAAASKAAAARRTVTSSRQWPAICSPTGRPSRVKPAGTEMAGALITVKA